MKNEKKNFQVGGMTCSACQANVTKKVHQISGVEKVDVNLLSGKMVVEFDPKMTDENAIVQTVKSIGYDAETINSDTKKQGSKDNNFQSEWKKRKERTEQEKKSKLKNLIASIVILLPLMYIAMANMLKMPLPSFLQGVENAIVFVLLQLILTSIILLLNKKFFTVGYKALFKGAPNMDTLVAIGSSSAYIYGIFVLFQMSYALGHGNVVAVEHFLHQLYFESSAMIVTLISLGKFLESVSKSKTSSALDKLVALSPKMATILVDGEEKIVQASDIQVGDIVVVKSGETIAVDGRIVEGNGYVNEANLTGESMPVEKFENSKVMSATINQNGYFKFVAEHVGDDTSLAKIIKLVDEAGSSKAPIARLADKISGYFVPVVMAISLLTAIVWLSLGKGFEFALSMAISVLVISCPCALGLATPVAIMVGTGKSAELGILIKSAQSLERLKSVNTVVVDKTGTLTLGKPKVTDIIQFSNTMSEDEFLQIFASLEKASEHPLGEAIVKHATERNLKFEEVEDFESIFGKGIKGKVEGEAYVVGNKKFVETVCELNNVENEVLEALANEGKTPLLIANESTLLGIVAVADEIRETSKIAVERLQKSNVSVVMLTGDNKRTAEAIRKQLGIEKAIAEVMPEEKEAVVSEFQKVGKIVAMVGDGVNDSVALEKADVGIAVGEGSDIAIESADIVLMKNDLRDVSTAIDLSKRVVGNIKMNLFWAFFYNILGIPIACGILYPFFAIKLDPMIGALAMSLSSVCVVLNALTLKFFKPKFSGKVIVENSQIKRESDPVEKDQICDFVSNNSKIEFEKQGSAEKVQVAKNVSLAESKAKKENEKGENKMEKSIKIEGMMCAHCQKTVEKILSNVDGVSNVNVDLETKTAKFECTNDVDFKMIKQKIEDSGYEIVE